MTASILAGLGPITAGLRAAIAQPGDFTVRPVSAPFHIIGYNIAMLPYGYRGREQIACRDAIIAEILASGADVVGLCEGWAHNDGIAAGVRHVYPYRGHEPGLDLLGLHPMGAGLALLSRHPFLAAGERAYKDSAGTDILANKGISWVRIHPPGLPGPLDLFLTHTQAVYEDASNTGAAEHAKQLAQLAAYVAEKRDANNPAIVFGDLNFDGCRAQRYAPAMALLGAPVDTWVSRLGNHGDGVTYSKHNDFDKDYDAARGETGGIAHEERLDYVLLYPGRSWTLCMDAVAVLQWRTASYGVSDHYGLQARSSYGLAYP